MKLEDIEVKTVTLFTLTKLLMKNPTKSSRKEEIIKFMEAKNINLPAKRTKVELLKVIDDCNIDKTKSYVVDNLAREKGHTVLRLPPYYCIFKAIELIWSQLKHAIRKGNHTPNLSASVVDLIREKSNKIDVALWESCVKEKLLSRRTIYITKVCIQIIRRKSSENQKFGGRQLYLVQCR
jgi:transposase